MKKAADFTLTENRRLTDRFSLLTLKGDIPADVQPGQFVQVRVDNSKTTFLRRPISINEADPATGTLRLLIRRAGDGTNALCDLEPGAVVNMLLPLGNGFTVPADKSTRILLVGGGVGVAPMMMLGRVLKDNGLQPEFLIGARTAGELLLIDEFRKIGTVHTATDDGTSGEKGFAHQHSVLACAGRWDKVCCCGPAPMMKGVAAAARAIGADCKVSLENMMACGLGACLCCVEKTVAGNVCVCTYGPVFNVKELTW